MLNLGGLLCRPMELWEGNTQHPLMCAWFRRYYILLANYSCSKSTRLSLHCLTMDDAKFSQPIQTPHDRCMQDLLELPFRCQTLLSTCAHTMSDVCWPLMIFVAIDRFFLLEAYKPLLMIPAIGRYHCHQEYKHTPWAMGACIGKLNMCMYEEACYIHTNHTRCYKSFNYVGCCWPRSTCRCINGLKNCFRLDACTP